MTWKPASLILATFAFTVPAHTQGTLPSPRDTGRMIIARLFPQRSPVRGFLRLKRPKRSGLLVRVLSSTCCRNRSFPRARSGARNRGSIFLAAFGCRTPGMESSLRRRKIICGRGLAAPPVATTQAAGDLLPGRLLDVMEHGETGAFLRLFQCGLVSRRN
jgi:hypothetical protein